MRKKIKPCECRKNPSIYFVRKKNDNRYFTVECDLCGKRINFHLGGDAYD